MIALNYMLRKFHEKFGGDAVEHRAALLREECDEALWELNKAVSQSGPDLEALAKELADVIYIAAGTAYCYGINIDGAIAEVHRANMQKVKGEGHKPEKPPGWRPPDMSMYVP